MPSPANSPSITDINSKLESLCLPESQSSPLSLSSSLIGSPPNLSPRSLDIPTTKPTPDKSTTSSPPTTSEANVQSDQKWCLDGNVLESVVKIYVTHCEPKYIRPWQMGAQSYTTSSGLIIPDKLILTNAHSVEHHTLVRIKRRTQDKRYIAKVLAIAEECDLAVLTVEDESFWENNETKLNALHIGEIPKLRDSVIVAGYPHGGDGMSVTAGVVSRVELFDYTNASTLLSIQIDAAINPGNSGGPAFDSNGNIVGVAFRVMTGDDSENIGYLIPPNVVKHFLDDVKLHGKYTGFCTCGFQWNDLECDAARRFHKLPTDESGIIVRSLYNYNNNSSLQANDIITHIDNVRISNSGTISHVESGERMLFHVLVAEKLIGDTVKLRVFRKGKFINNIIHKLSNINEYKLIPIHLNPSNKKPEYFVFGGFVFIALSGPYLKSGYGSGIIAESRIPVNIRWLFEFGIKKTKDEQVVVLSHVLNSEFNIHYEHLFDERIVKVNDIEINNLKHLYELVKNCQEEFVKFELMEETIILDRKEALRENQQILDMHHISKDSSFQEDEGGD